MLINMLKGANGGCNHHHTMMIGQRLGATKTLICLLLLISGTWQIDATYEGRAIAEQEEETLHPIGDEFIDAGSPSSSSSSSSEAIVNRLSSLTAGGRGGPGDQEEAEEEESTVRRPLLLLNSPTDRLGFCNESTVSHLTAVHFQILENGLREYRCWTPRLGRLMSTLRQEMSRGGGGSGGPSGGGGGGGRSRQQQSANEGSRLRCRILFKYDTCRSNFAKYRSMDSPEISIEWPEEILNVINNNTLL